MTNSFVQEARSSVVHSWSRCENEVKGNWSYSLALSQYCIKACHKVQHFKEGMVSFHLFTFLYLLVQCLLMWQAYFGDYQQLQMSLLTTVANLSPFSQSIARS